MAQPDSVGKKMPIRQKYRVIAGSMIREKENFAEILPGDSAVFPHLPDVDLAIDVAPLLRGPQFRKHAVEIRFMLRREFET